MGLFLQTALFPGCDEETARKTVETASKNSEFTIDLNKCQYANCYEGTQVLIVGDELGFDSLAKFLSDTAKNPVMLLYIYDDDFWGYDFYMGEEEDHFNTIPDYFGTITKREKQSLAGNPDILAGWFNIPDKEKISRYLLHWSDYEMDTLEFLGTAYPQDSYPYGEAWQMVDFAAQLGFFWPFDESEDIPALKPQFPTLSEILQNNIPSISKQPLLENYPIICKLPSAFSHEYIKKLLAEDGIENFHFKDKTPLEIIETANKYRFCVNRPDCDALCQRMAVLAAFCDFWMENISGSWRFLDRATYEPLFINYEKPTDVYVLRSRAAITDYSKNHRAIRDLERLQEIDSDNYMIYQQELDNWHHRQKQKQQELNNNFDSFMRQTKQKEDAIAEKEQKRLALILEKRRKRKEKKPK